MRGDHGHGVQSVQFAVAAAHLVFGAPLLGHVENESLIALNVAGSVAGGEAAFGGQQQRAIFAAQRGVEIPHIVIGFDFLAEMIALLGVDADLCIQIEDKKFFALRVSEHVHEGVVAVDELTGGAGYVNALLYLLEEQTVFFFGRTAVRDVADHVNRAFLRAALLGVGRSRNDRVAAEAGVGAFGEFLIAAHGAVRTAGPFAKVVRQSGVARCANNIRGGLPELFEQNLIGLDDAEVGVVGQDDVVNRIEGVDPLPLRAQYLLEQAEVFDGDG